MKLVGTIREGDDDELQTFLRLFRTSSSSASVDDSSIKDHLQDRFLSVPKAAPTAMDKTGLSLQQMRAEGSSIPAVLETLYNEPVCTVRSIHLWTSVVDDATASHLFSLYFSWDDQIWCFVDRTIFLQDLNAGCRRFCSPLLVHVVLLYACVCLSVSGYNPLNSTTMVSTCKCLKHTDKYHTNRA